MILFSQHSGHSTLAVRAGLLSCSDAKYAAPATSTKLRPPPKERPGTLGIGRGIAVHLSIDMGGAIGPIKEPARAGPSECDTIRPNDGKAWGAARAYPCGRPASQRPDRQGATMQVGISHAMLSVLVTHRAGSA